MGVYLRGGPVRGAVYKVSNYLRGGSVRGAVYKVSNYPQRLPEKLHNFVNQIN